MNIKVGQLRINGLEISSFNISAGYFKPHSYASYVIPSKLFTSYDLVMELFKDFPGQSTFAKEVYKAPTYSVGEAFDNHVAKLINDAYMREHKFHKQHNVGNIIKWVVKKISAIDTKNVKIFPEYVEMIDTIAEYFTVEGCDFDTCKESKYTDYHCLNGPEEVCMTCQKTKKKQPLFVPQHDHFDGDWEDFRRRF